MAVIEVKYFNTFWLKKMTNVVGNTPTAPTAPYANVPHDYTALPLTDWAIEEARIRGGYNNTTVDFGVKAYLDEEDPIQQNRFNTLIYSGIFNSRTGINQTNQFSVGQDITRSLNPAHGSIQKLYAEDTNLIVFQEDKVSRALINKDAIYSAEGNPLVTSTNLVIGQIIAYAGEYGISNNPESFAVYGYRKYFSDKKRGCVLRLSKDGMTEISSYGMHDFFRDQLQTANSVVGGWDNHTKNYNICITSERIGTGQVGQNGGSAALVGNDVTVTLNAQIGSISAGDKVYKYTTSGQITGEYYATITSVIQITNPASFVANVFNEIPALQAIICWTEPSVTLSFDESVLGWTSFYSYEPTYVTSLVSDFYSFFNGKLYLHNSGKYGTFYGITNNSDVTLVLNAHPSVVKNFKTINYEGANGWELESMIASSGDITVPITKYSSPSNINLNSLAALELNMFANNFKRKENKFFGNLINNSSSTSGEILWGADSTGIKGFFSTVKMKLEWNTTNTDDVNYYTKKKELFSVSSDIVESSY